MMMYVTLNTGSVLILLLLLLLFFNSIWFIRKKYVTKRNGIDIDIFLIISLLPTYSLGKWAAFIITLFYNIQMKFVSVIEGLQE